MSLNFLKGPVKVYIKAVTSTSPVSANAVTWTGWDQLGWKSKKGVSWKLKAKTEDSDVEEFNTPVEGEITEESLTVTMNLKQVDVADLKYAILGSSYAGYTAGQYNTQITGGGGNITYFSLGIEGVSVNGKACVLYVPKVRADESFDVDFKRGSSEIPFNFTAYADTTKAGGKQLFEFTELY